MFVGSSGKVNLILQQHFNLYVVYDVCVYLPYILFMLL